MTPASILTMAHAMPVEQRAALINQLVLSMDDPGCAMQMMRVAHNARDQADYLSREAFLRQSG